MKKVIFIVLSIMLLAMFTACGCSTDANVEGDMGTDNNNSGQVTDDGRDGSSNEGVVGGSASADFEANIGNDTTTDNTTDGSMTDGTDTAEGRMGDSRNGRSKTSSNSKGELSQLASLIGADDFKVIDTLGEGDPDTVISGNIALVKRRSYTLPVFGNKESVILSFGDDGLIENIEISPNYAPTIWTMNISGEYGVSDKVSTDGLDYDYYAVWRNDKEKIELVCWNNKMSVQITKA